MAIYLFLHLSHLEKINIFLRFAKVFEQTYTRFLDLQKAEAQARESQIQLALERVRARTMAMQKSDELREAVLVIYEQLQELDFESQACNIIIIDKETGIAVLGIGFSARNIILKVIMYPVLIIPIMKHHAQSMEEGDKYVVYEYSGRKETKFDEIFLRKLISGTYLKMLKIYDWIRIRKAINSFHQVMDALQL